MVGFRTADEALWVLISNDARKFYPLPNQPAYDPASLRDPTCILWQNWYYIAYTTASFTGGTSFDIIRTQDFISFEFVKTVDCTSISGVAEVWGPQFLIDDGILYVLFSTAQCIGCSQSLFWTRPTDQANLSGAYDTLTSLTGTGLPADCFSPVIVKRNGIYHLFCTDDIHQYSVLYTSTSPFSGYTAYGTGDWMGWGRFLESNRIFRLNDGTYRIVFDGYGTRQDWYSDSQNLLSWSPKQLFVIDNDWFISNYEVIRIERPADIATFRAYVSALHL